MTIQTINISDDTAKAVKAAADAERITYVTKLSQIVETWAVQYTTTHGEHLEATNTWTAA